VAAIRRQAARAGTAGPTSEQVDAEIAAVGQVRRVRVFRVGASGTPPACHPEW
jgi:hypothetical protein